MCEQILDIVINLRCKPNSPLALDHNPDPGILPEAFLACGVSDCSRQ